MTEQELEKELQKTAERIKGLEQPDQPMTKKQRNLKHMLRLQEQALQRIKAAKGRNDQRTEIKAGIDYAVFKEYENRHPFIVFLVKARTRWYEI